MTMKEIQPQQTKTREEHRKESRQAEEKAPKGRKRKPRVRLIPIWMRVLIVLVLIVVCAGAGAVVGYSVMGDGKPGDTFKKSTWTHIYDIVNKK
ncbi:DNA-directed RNA polymerase subunit beta [Falsibacillus pallidus]|uniref:DNA-directed RNA polymerase subunit beta n=1 Tax=Falsibacillus pallidus TaxID=493781 RepID=UPI003D98FDC2